MSKIICTSCTIKISKKGKALTIIDKERGEPVPLPQTHHLQEENGKTVLVKRIPKVTLNSKKQKLISWESKVDPKYEVKEEEKEVFEEADKVFKGTKYEAEKAGWLENEFGWVCPECSGISYEGDGTATNPLEDELMASAVLKSLSK